MITIREKTINDLEFRKVALIVKQYCTTELGKQAAEQLSVFANFEECQKALVETSEYLSSFSNENIIPNHGFDSINKELQLLHIENSTFNIQYLSKKAQQFTLQHVETNIDATIECKFEYIVKRFNRK